MSTDDSTSSAEQVALTLRLDKAQHERLRNTAHVLRRPISELIREAIDKTHFHAAGVWCDDCPPTYRVPSMSAPKPADEDRNGHVPISGSWAAVMCPVEGVAAHNDGPDGCSACGANLATPTESRAT